MIFLRRLLRRHLRHPLLLAAALALLLPSAATAAGNAPAPAWRPWSDQVFAEARRSNKFVLLDLEAVWCHWCHVMDQKTYADPAVRRLLAERYITLKVDQDARPDLARKYQDWGWPATIVFDADGREIVKRAGYIPPANMARLLQAIIQDPSPEDADAPTTLSAPADAKLPAALRAELERRFATTSDLQKGGLRQNQRFIDRDTVEYALRRTTTGDATARRIALTTLDGGLKLLDPVWGGVYQYSTGGDWNYPHFEKLALQQAEYLRLYTLAWRQTGDSRYLQAALAIRRYVAQFLMSPEGAFYVSQDADLRPGEHSGGYFRLNDAQRRKLGVPRVDTHRYARENGWLIEAFATLGAATGDQLSLQQAERAARWVLANRPLPGGGFRHDTADSGGPYLDDTLAMGRAFLALYVATANREWLGHAEAALRFISQNFAAANGLGYLIHAPRGPLAPAQTIDENIAVARYANQVFHYTGNAGYRIVAERALRYLAASEVALSRKTEAGILLAAEEMASDPPHFTVVGGKSDPAAQRLYRAALGIPSGSYRRVEWLDPSEGPLPNPDVQYPRFDRAAAFVCTHQRCSLPVFEVAELKPLAERLAKSR